MAARDFQASLTLFHKLLHRGADSLSQLLVFPFAHTTSSRCRCRPLQLLLRQGRTTRYRESFLYHSALTWTSLPQDIQAHINSTTFQKAIEQYWSAHRYKTMATLRHHSLVPTLIHTHCLLLQHQFSGLILSSRSISLNLWQHVITPRARDPLAGVPFPVAIGESFNLFLLDVSTEREHYFKSWFYDLLAFHDCVK